MTIPLLQDFWDSLSISPTPQTMKTGCYVLRTPNTLDHQFLILFTSAVLIMGGTSSTPTTELNHRSLMDIPSMPSMNYAKWKFMVIFIIEYILSEC